MRPQKGILEHGKLKISKNAIYQKKQTREKICEHKVQSIFNSCSSLLLILRQSFSTEYWSQRQLSPESSFLLRLE